MTILKEFLELEAKATPGPWKASFAHWGKAQLIRLRPEFPYDPEASYHSVTSYHNGVAFERVTGDHDLSFEDAIFIEFCRNKLPALIHQLVLSRIKELWNAQPDSKEGHELSELAPIVDAYEHKTYPELPPALEQSKYATTVSFVGNSTTLEDLFGAEPTTLEEAQKKVAALWAAEELIQELDRESQKLGFGY